MAERFFMQVECAELASIVEVNGCTAFSAFDGLPRAARYPLTPWLVEGVNQLRILAGPSPEHDELEPLLRVTIYLLHEGQDPWLGGMTVAYQWTENESPPTQSVAEVFTHKFRCSLSLPSWQWHDASEYDPTHDREIMDAAQSMHAALGSGNKDLVRELLASKLDDQAAGLGVDREALEANLKQRLDNLYESKDFELEPLHQEGLQIVVGARGRLVHLVTDSGLPPIRARGGEEMFYLALSMARVGGRYRVIR